eukprot:6307653-Pyramimonas_sp.AAC.2
MPLARLPSTSGPQAAQPQQLSLVFLLQVVRFMIVEKMMRVCRWVIQFPPQASAVQNHSSGLNTCSFIALNAHPSHSCRCIA